MVHGFFRFGNVISLLEDPPVVPGVVAFDLVGRCSPAYLRWIGRGLREIVPVAAPDGAMISGSHTQRWGEIYMTDKLAPLKLAEMLGASSGSSALPPDQVTLSRVNAQAATLYAQIWPADAEPTSAQMEAVAATERGSETVMNRWETFKATDLPELNRELREAKEIHGGCGIRRWLGTVVRIARTA